MKKYIRLKEQQAKKTVIHLPNETYCEIRPNLDKKLKYVINTDENGFIKTGNNFSSQEKIFLLGDSFVESMYSSEYLRMSSCLERKLITNNMYYQVINAGVSGATSLNILNLIINKIVKFKPKMVVIFIPTNDVYANNYIDGFWNDTKRFSNIFPPTGKSFFDNKLTENKISEITNIYKLIIEACKLFKIDIIISASPFVDKYDKDFYKVLEASFNDAKKKRKKIYNEVFKICQDMGVKFFESKNYADDSCFYDDVHLNDKGGIVFSNLIFDNIKDSLDIDTELNYKEFNLPNIDMMDQETVWNIIECEKSIDKIILFYKVDCDDEAIRNNGLFCLDLDYENELDGLIYSKSVGYFNYLNTDKNLKMAFNTKFTLPKKLKNFKIGFRSWHKNKTMSLSDVKILAFLKS